MSTGLYRGERGQAIVEMALILPLFLLLILGIVEMGRIGYAYITVNNAARAGARVASVGGTDQEITTAVQNAAPSLDTTDIHIDIQPAQDQRISGDSVTVDVSYPVQLIMPLLEGVIPNPVNVEAKLEMRAE